MTDAIETSSAGTAEMTTPELTMTIDTVSFYPAAAVAAADGGLIGAVPGETAEETRQRLSSFRVDGLVSKQYSGGQYSAGRYEPMTEEPARVRVGIIELGADELAAGGLAGELLESELPDEDGAVSLDAAATPADGEPLEDGSEDVVYELAVAAATLAKGLDGPTLAALLDGTGEVEDVRLSIAIETLRLGAKVTGERVLQVLTLLGFTEEVAAARIAREEIARAGEVVVESGSALPVVPEGDA